MNYSPPGSSGHVIFQARILEWVAISFSQGSFWPRDQTWVLYISYIAGEFFYCWGIRGALAQKPGTSGFCAFKEFLSRISQAQRCTYLVMKVGRHPVSDVQNDGCRERSWQWLLRNGLHSYISPDTPCAWCAVYDQLLFFLFLKHEAKLGFVVLGYWDLRLPVGWGKLMC